MSYFFFFYNILLGVFSCFGRIFKGVILGIFFLSRIDRTSLMQGFQTWDRGKEFFLLFCNASTVAVRSVFSVSDGCA